MSANQKYKEYKRGGGSLPFNLWVEVQNQEHLNVTGIENAKEKVKDFFKPSDLSDKKSGITILGMPAGTVVMVTVGIIIIGTVYYYTQKAKTV